MVATSYGFIPDNELVIEKFPSEPLVKIENCLESLVIDKIDKKTSYIQVKNQNFSQGKFVSLDSINFKHISQYIETADTLFKTKFSKRTFTIPIYLTPKLSYFIGYFAADGALKNIFKSFDNRGRFDYKFKVGDEFLVQTQIIQNIFNELFGYAPPIRTERIEKGEKYYYIELGSKVVYRYLTGTFGFPCGSKTDCLEIPPIIRNAPKELRKWFVRGFLDADGAVKTMEQYDDIPVGNYVYINIKPLKFELQLMDIIKEDFGVQFFKPSHDKEYEAWKTGTSAFKNIIRLHEQKIFIHPIKRWRLEKLVKILNTGTVAQSGSS